MFIYLVSVIRIGGSVGATVAAAFLVC